MSVNITKRMSLEGNMGADWTRTCEGCGYVRAVPWPVKGSYRMETTAYRCFAPGPRQGCHIGTERFVPYIPAWCPERKKTAPDGASIEDGRPEGQI